MHLSIKSGRKLKVQLRTKNTIICPCIHPYYRSLFLHMASGCVQCPSVPTERILYSVSCTTVLVDINSFCFCLSGNVLLSPLFLKYRFSGYRILDWQVGGFSLNILNMSSSCLLASMASDKKPAVRLTQDLSESHLFALEIPCVFEFDYKVFRCRSL